ncbi:MAG: hypothetical protein JSR93_00325 [Verrucomicrobia bacterium]|nr:hypothetical protein [Verrucomicrobiota bacterium]
MPISRVQNSFQLYEEAQTQRVEGNPLEGKSINNAALSGSEDKMNGYPVGHAQNRGSQFHDINGIPSIASATAKVIDSSLASKADWMRYQANSSKHPVDVVDKFGKAANSMQKTYQNYSSDEKLTVGTVLAGGIAGAAALTGIACFIGDILKRLTR